MASLKSRIGKLKSLGLRPASELGRDEHRGVVGKVQGGNPKEKVDRATLPGWTALGRGIQTRTLSTGFFLPDSLGDHFFPSAFERTKKIDASLQERSLGYDELAFFDLETTGLSGGSGTIAFLAALGYFEGRDFLVTQVFIDDYPGEQAFLEFISSIFMQRPWAVTYNGAAFDLPLLRTRCIMNGAAMPQLDHIDLLKQARRLWKRSLGSCSLKSIEERVLGFEREGDIPGFLIPRIWLDYSAGAGEVRGDGFETLLKVFEHNAQDVISLARLFLKVEAIMRRPLDLAQASRVYLPGLALELMSRGREAEGLELLEACGGEGDQFSLHILASFFRRASKPAERERVIEAMDPGTFSGCVAKAKFSEHGLKDWKGALEWTHRAAFILKGLEGSMAKEEFDAQNQALGLRKKRLEGKLRR